MRMATATALLQQKRIERIKSTANLRKRCRDVTQKTECSNGIVRMHDKSSPSVQGIFKFNIALNQRLTNYISINPSDSKGVKI